MKYLSLTVEEKKKYLEILGQDDIDSLFSTIPDSVRFNTDASLPLPKSEIEIRDYFETLGESNKHNSRTISFLGGTAHTHYIPSVIDPLVGRGEYLTAYTPYQPEVSQGTLQALFEYQSMMASLMGVEVSNASLYDGATSLVESILMSMRVTGKEKCLIAGELHPQYMETLKTYMPEEGKIFLSPADSQTGQVDIDALKKSLNSDLACVVIQSPNYLGIIEKVSAIKESISASGALLIVVITEALSLGLLKSPGSQGADIVCGEAQSFGIPLSFGGPYLGMLGSSMKHVRNFPGRLVGETKDESGRRGFVITLSTREQHIRRDKATSNICTNQGLMSLRAGIYLSVMGKQGIKEAANRSASFASYAREEIQKSSRIKIIGTGPIFNEFILEFDISAKKIFDTCFDKANIFIGNIVSENRILAAFNETMSPEIVNKWINTIRFVIS